ncbi:hypothetical protein GCM10023261_11510 [Bartonella jaculi]|uniref:Uncharacterized protein n=1 Tax=Bartonella jaculi TaxID=686226 RepID=A0ABP9N3W6_9HYPH
MDASSGIKTSECTQFGRFLSSNAEIACFSDKYNCKTCKVSVVSSFFEGHYAYNKQHIDL